MPLRSTTRLAAGLVGAALLASTVGACGDEDDGAAAPLPGQVVYGSVRERQEPPPAEGTALDALVAADTELALDLYGQVIASPDVEANVVIGPYSASVALTMALAGAEGTTADELAAALHVADDATTHDTRAALDVAVREVDGDDVTLSIANQLFGQEGFAFEEPFLDVLAGRYGAPLAVEQFETDPEGSLKRINEWTGEATGGRIPALFPEGSMDEETRLVAVNAMHLDAPWQWTFDEDDTEPRAFTLASDEVVQVPTMLLEAGGADLEMGQARGDGWRAVEIPYQGERLALLVIEPDDIAAFEGGLDAARLAEVTEALEPGSVDRLQLPRFTVRTKTDLVPALEALGVHDAFDEDRSDFSGITTEAPLVISGVLHEAFIQVDEEGTEAAAATGEVFQEAGAPAPELEPITIIDRPFLYAVRDTETGAVLFVGRVTDPRETAEP